MISIPRTGAVVRFAGNPIGALRSWQVWDLRGPLRCYVLAVPVVYAAAFAVAAIPQASSARKTSASRACQVVDAAAKASNPA